MYYYDFVNKANIDYTSTARSNNWITYDDDLRTFTINHTLNNNITDNGFDSSPYIFTFEIRHQDDNSYTTGDIVIIQYPAMYIDELQSNKYAFLNGTGNQKSSDVSHVYDDHSNSLSSLSSRDYVDDSDNQNKNSHMYRVHVTAVAGMSYTIGDPRLWSTRVVTTLDNLGEDYMETAGINEDMISPEFMVASSVGAHSVDEPLSYQFAATRCAAYQESGYPAGRWRVPTKAEILFLITLSGKSKIPQLFSPDSALSKGGYWCSSGVVYPLNDGTITYLDFDHAASYNSNKNWVRCIYDSWYWGEAPIDDYLTTWSGYLTTDAS